VDYRADSSSAGISKISRIRQSRSALRVTISNALLHQLNGIFDNALALFSLSRGFIKQICKTVNRLAADLQNFGSVYNLPVCENDLPLFVGQQFFYS